MCFKWCYKDTDAMNLNVVPSLFGHFNLIGQKCDKRASWRPEIDEALLGKTNAAACAAAAADFSARPQLTICRC